MEKLWFYLQYTNHMENNQYGMNLVNSKWSGVAND